MAGAGAGAAGAAICRAVVAAVVVAAEVLRVFAAAVDARTDIAFVRPARRDRAGGGAAVGRCRGAMHAITRVGHRAVGAGPGAGPRARLGGEARRLGFPARPVDPGGGEVGGVRVDVLGERDDRDLDVARVGGQALQRRQQLMGRGLEGADLVVRGHGSGVVEGEGDAQLGQAPCHRGGGADRDRRNSHHLHERRRDDAGAGHGERRGGCRIGRGDRDVRQFGPVEVGVEVVARLLGDLARIERGDVLREGQRGGIQRRLHGGAGRVGAAVVDGRAGQPDQGHQRDREYRRDAAAAVLQEATHRHDADLVRGHRPRAGRNGTFQPDAELGQRHETRRPRSVVRLMKTRERLLPTSRSRRPKLVTRRPDGQVKDAISSRA